jgi:hypothetical protein
MAKRKGAQVLSGVYNVLRPRIPIAKISPLNNIHALPKSPQYFRPCASKVFWIFQYLPHYIILKAEKIWTVVYKSQIPKPIYQRNRGNGLLERPPKQNGTKGSCAPTLNRTSKNARQFYRETKNLGSMLADGTKLSTVVDFVKSVWQI